MARAHVKQPPRALTLGEAEEIVARFGRFPKRNAALGRETPPEEADYLKTHPGW